MKIFVTTRNYLSEKYTQLNANKIFEEETLKNQRHLHTKSNFSKACYLKWQPTLRVGGKWIFNVTNQKGQTHPGNRRADPCPGFPTNFPRNWSTTITINTRGSKRWGLCWLLNSSSRFWVLQVILFDWFISIRWQIV